jgi:hypothetical protein
VKFSKILTKVENLVTLFQFDFLRPVHGNSTQTDTQTDKQTDRQTDRRRRIVNGNFSEDGSRVTRVIL